VNDSRLPQVRLEVQKWLNVVHLSQFTRYDHFHHKWSYRCKQLDFKSNPFSNFTLSYTGI